MPVLGQHAYSQSGGKKGRVSADIGSQYLFDFPDPLSAAPNGQSEIVRHGSDFHHDSLYCPDFGSIRGFHWSLYALAEGKDPTADSKNERRIKRAVGESGYTPKASLGCAEIQ